VRDLYEEGKKVDKEVFKEDIRLSDQRIATVVGFFSLSNDNTINFLTEASH
jgi:hypothetical protein